MEAAPLACPVCSHAAGNRVHHAREMMFGTREPFRYGECAGCGLLWLLDVPDDLSPYYPPDYYAFNPPPKRTGRLRAWAKRVWARHHLVRPSLLGALLTRVEGTAPFFGWLRHTGLPTTARILDVGAGQGRLLRLMRSCGLPNLTGADPYIDRDAVLPGGVRLLRRDVGEIEGTYDLVMCHHAFEHMPAPLDRLRELRARMADDGWLLLRLPVADSWAWRHYGTDWVALDPPRHLFLHTRRSLERLAAEAGLRIEAVEWDSEAFTLWASEQYRRDIPLVDPCSYRINPAASSFTEADIKAFSAEAARLNAAGDGDTAAYYFRPA